MVLVRVNEGLLEGECLVNEYGGTYCSFKGIPYAEPPVGDLRFQAPRAPKSWDGIRSAKKFGPICYQTNPLLNKSGQGSEDCLYLNIYTPDVNPNKPWPVMFWIHGGYFERGSGNDDNFGPQFLIRHNVILVTINYRLGVFGFLCTNTKEIPGNAGMKDQVAALKWVNKNISNFGGDPHNITLFGESMGATCVCYHLVSPMTKGLFSKVIAQSSVSNAWWGETTEPRERALALARQMGFYSKDDKKLTTFFKSLPVESLINISIKITLADVLRPYGGPVLSIVNEKQFDGVETYFHGDIHEVIANDIHKDVEIIVGYNCDEGMILLPKANSFDQYFIDANNFHEYFVPNWFNEICTIGKQLNIGRKMRAFYFECGIVKKQYWEQLSKYLSMESFLFDIIQFAKIYSKNSNRVYFYKFSCKSERNLIGMWNNLDATTKSKQVVTHGDELGYIFDNKHFEEKVDIDSDTFRMIDNVTSLWTNFAKYGNPTPDNSLGVTWKPFTREAQDYLIIGEELTMSKKPEADQIDFWENIFEEHAPKLIFKKKL